jgi:predicted transcriptional regulator of viral defense system
LDHPRLFGDLHDTSLHWQRLIEYAVRGSPVPTCQRLGVLIQEYRQDTFRLDPLAERVAQTRSSLSMLPGMPRRGQFHPRWSLMDNRPGIVPKNELIPG